MHITLGCHVLIKSVNLLYFRKRCKCNNIADLCLSTGKHGRTMYTRDQIYFCSQRTDLIDRTSIWTLMIL